MKGRAPSPTDEQDFDPAVSGPPPGEVEIPEPSKKKKKAKGAADPSAAFATSAGLDEYWFEESSGDFWLKNEAADWIALGTPGLVRHLKKRGKRDKVAPGKTLSQVEEVIRDVEQNRRVEMAGIFAGWPQGFRLISGRRCLVSKELPKIVPVKGEWPMLKAFFDGLLVGKEPLHDDKGGTMDIDQRDHFYSWLQHLMQCYQNNIIDSGLAFCLAGEPDSGKSRLAMILRWLLGERVAKPYAFMIGRDNFNRDMFEAVLQLVDDETADTNLNARLKFAAEIKKVVANDEVKQRGMHKDGFAVNVLRRLVVLVNLEANRLMVMPPIDGDIKDKLMMLKGYRRPHPAHAITTDTPAEQACWPMPMPTRTPAEKAALRDTWRAELPAFLWWLLEEYKMPSHVSGGRFGPRDYQHPQILERLEQFSPHVRLWQLLDSSRVIFHKWEPGTTGYDSDDESRPGRFVSVPEWRGSARDLYSVLNSDESKLTLKEKRDIPSPEWLGQRLEACSKAFGEDVCIQKRTAKARLWVLTAKEGLVD